MGFTFHIDESLPPLAWCAVLGKEGGQADVYCGDRVDCAPGLFSEGFHDGPEGPGGVLEATFCLATGGVQIDGQFHFFTPTHMLDNIYTIRVGERLVLSNSLPFLLSVSGVALDWSYIHYRGDIDNMALGVTPIPSSTGDPIKIYGGVNIAVGDDLTETVKAKVAPARFTGFEDYVAKLQTSLDTIVRRASAPASGHGYEPVATVSTGYDSTACAVFARNVGATRAITVRNPRAITGHEESDDGSQICGRLGLRVDAIDRLAYLDHGLDAEMLFYTRSEPEDIVFYGAQEAISGTLLFGGVYGDFLWDYTSEPHPPVREGNAGSSMQEFRLRNNFVHAQLAFFGWQWHKELRDLGLSEEMAPWRLNNSYDRPIPRRIVEGAGVPRDWFGQQKKAVAVVPLVEDSQAVVSEDLKAALDATYATEVPLRAKRRILIANQLRYVFYGAERVVKLTRYAGCQNSAPVQRLLGSLEQRRKRYSKKRFGKFNFALHWANNQLKDDYSVRRR